MRDAWLASNPSRPPAGFDIPNLAQNVPAECSDPALLDAANNLQQLSDDTRDELSFQVFVRGVVEDACGTEHGDALE